MVAVLVGEMLKYLQIKTGSSDLANNPQSSTGVVSGIAAPPGHAALVHSVERVFGWTYIILSHIWFVVVTRLIIRWSESMRRSKIVRPPLKMLRSC